VAGSIPSSQALVLTGLIAMPERGVANRVLAKTSGGHVTVFAFDAGEGLREHTTPFDALVLVLEGTLTLTIGGEAVAAAVGTITRLPANIPHAVNATTASRMLLIMLRDPVTGPPPSAAL
jgi:quercetin dioxygenase-like cupin family protein